MSKKRTPTKRTDATVYFQQLLDQFDLARRRVGEKPEERLRWLLQFVRTDLNLLHPEERRALAYDLRALLTPTNIGAREFRSSVLTPEEDDSLVEQLHAEIKRGLTNLLSEENSGWTFKQPDYVAICRSTKLNAKRIGFIKKVHFAAPSGKDAILNAVMDIILESGDLMRACSECKSPFVPVRRQEYCSIKCSQRARDRRRSK
jgi:hypothetical protein